MQDLTLQTLEDINGGGWGEFGLALGGTLIIAGGPVVWAGAAAAGAAGTGAAGGALLVGLGSKMIANTGR